MRYALMSHLKPATPPADTGHVESDRARAFDHRAKKFVEPDHVADLFTNQTRRLPGVRGVRPRIRR
jgi:hypothetical protein